MSFPTNPAKHFPLLLFSLSSWTSGAECWALYYSVCDSILSPGSAKPALLFKFLFDYFLSSSFILTPTTLPPMGCPFNCSYVSLNIHVSLKYLVCCFVQYLFLIHISNIALSSPSVTFPSILLVRSKKSCFFMWIQFITLSCCLWLCSRMHHNIFLIYYFQWWTSSHHAVGPWMFPF